MDIFGLGNKSRPECIKFYLKFIKFKNIVLKPHKPQNFEYSFLRMQ